MKVLISFLLFVHTANETAYYSKDILLTEVARVNGTWRELFKNYSPSTFFIYIFAYLVHNNKFLLHCQKGVIMILTYLRAARQVLITETYIGGWFLIFFFY